MSREHQDEFFREFKEEKGSIKKMADKITQGHKKLYVNLPVENIVFAIIIIIMAVVVAFALGVERGKRLVDTKTGGGSTYEEALATEPQIRMAPIEITAGERKEPEKEEIPLEKLQEKSKPYVIQLISYKKEQRAINERDRLSRSNVTTFIVPSGDWYQVCAGGYENIKEAKSALQNFAKEYKGCFIRKR